MSVLSNVNVTSMLPSAFSALNAVFDVIVFPFLSVSASPVVLSIMIPDTS